MKKYVYTFSFILIVIVTVFTIYQLTEKENKQVNRNTVDNTPLVPDSNIASNVIPSDPNSKVDSQIVKSVSQINNDSVSIKSKPKNVSKVIVYYFHPTARCVTCINIENYAKEVFDTEFKKEKKNLQMIWKSLNIEDSVNEHYIDDFKLQFSSLIIARYDNNHRKDWKNLEKVWSLVAYKEKYMTYVKLEIQQFTKPILEEIKNEN
jgi:hypothetical protein